jgi:hypothetical protein
MSINSHFNSLKKRHDELENEINFAYNTHLADTIITNLKKQKLRIKEELQTLEEKYLLVPQE